MDPGFFLFEYFLSKKGREKENEFKLLFISVHIL